MNTAAVNTAAVAAVNNAVAAAAAAAVTVSVTVTVAVIQCRAFRQHSCRVAIIAMAYRNCDTCDVCCCCCCHRRCYV